jgi:twitching motility protein PilT
MHRVDMIIQDAVDRGTSDIHMKTGQPPVFRINGQLIKQETGVITREAMYDIARHIIPPRLIDMLDGNEEIDFAYQTEHIGRFRCNMFLSGSEPALVMRHVKNRIPDFTTLNLPENFSKIALKRRGIVILSGATGSGKSSTLAAMMNHMNNTEFRRIITIEDPIEYLFTDALSVISQREVGLDTPTFFHGLKAALRQDPDVIMIGELRDHASFEAALMASETGHMILTTLHADTADQAINRILDIFPKTEHEAILSALAKNLQAIICQRLVPDTLGGIRPAVEVLINTPVVTSLLEDGNLSKLNQVITNGKEDGMCTFNQYLYQLIKANLITEETGMKFASNPEALKMNLKGIFIDSGQTIIGT